MAYDYEGNELRCGQAYRKDCKGPVDRRYSFGVYAGVLCVHHAKHSFRDGCGLIDGQQGRREDLDEEYDADDY